MTGKDFSEASSKRENKVKINIELSSPVGHSKKNNSNTIKSN